MVARRVTATPMASLCISAITQGETAVWPGEATGGHTSPPRRAEELLRCVDALPWDSATAGDAMEPFGLICRVRARFSRRLTC